MLLTLGTSSACYTGRPDEAAAGGGAFTTLTTLTTLTTPTDTSDTATTAAAATAATTEDDTTAAQSTSGSTGAQGTNTSAGETTANSGPDDPVLPDLGGPPDPPKADKGCTKVDFLFVIDNSGSMLNKQTKLLGSFDGFLAAIQGSFQGDSYHVGVITSDNYAGNAPGCQTIGDLVSQTAGTESASMDCTPFVDGHRFATEKDDLNAKFPCMAKVGIAGSGTEQPVTALVAALTPAKASPGGCNAGFLRDDAILVVVIITDDPPSAIFDDAHPATDTSGWHAAVLAAKDNDPMSMVVIGFVPWACDGKYASPNLIEFVQSFGDQGVLASICEDDFGPIFAQAIETIVNTCEEFPTPG